jgi:hypothetical protein
MHRWAIAKNLTELPEGRNDDFTTPCLRNAADRRFACIGGKRRTVCANIVITSGPQGGLAERNPPLPATRRITLR